MLGLGRLFQRKREQRGGDVGRAVWEAPELAPHATRAIIEEIVSPDGKRRFRLHERNDGFFVFDEMIERDDEYAGLYWQPVRGSGLYHTAREARRDALAEIPWTRLLP